jgi:hypothetical protein
MAPRPIHKRKTKATTKKTEWRVQWVKLSTDEDFVAKVKEVSDGYFVVDAMVIAYVNGLINFSPYGLMCEGSDFFVARDVVIHSLDVMDSARELYEVSLKTVPMCREGFNDIIVKSLESLKGALSGSVLPTMVELGAEDFDLQIEEVLGHPPSSRSRTQVLDSLVDLADKAGKGKKVKKVAD